MTLACVILLRAVYGKLSVLHLLKCGTWIEAIALAHRGQDVRVHWWYRPDSYDEFVAASVAPLELDDDKPNTKGACPDAAPIQHLAHLFLT